MRAPDDPVGARAVLPTSVLSPTSVVDSDAPDLVDCSDVGPGDVPAFMRDWWDTDDPLASAAAVAVDELIAAAQTATRCRTVFAAKVVAADDDAAVLSRLAAIGICGEAAISLIGSSTEALVAVAEEVLGVDHTAAAAAALHRVWTAAKLPGRRQLTDLSRRLIPSTPPRSFPLAPG